MNNYKCLLCIFSILLLSGCKKMIEIGEPINTITTSEIFLNNTQAEWAINGVYSKLTHGVLQYSRTNSENTFSTGLATLLGSLSSDELTDVVAAYALFVENKVKVGVKLSEEIWYSAYKIIYDANAVIEGINESKSLLLSDSVKKHITGEALAIRAFSYFYLVNFYGDVPLALSTDFNVNNKLPRVPVSKVYEQIIADLVQAKPLLTDNFAIGKNEKVRITKWFAEALLARVYLYTKDYPNAIASASAVINQKSLFYIEQDINKVFLKNSPEAILQFKPVTTIRTLRAATPEGAIFNSYLGAVAAGGKPFVSISNSLLNAFEAGDARKTAWLIARNPGYYTPYKYKSGITDLTQTEYYTVMRLAELHLIRAEANFLLSNANKNSAIDDLNSIRQRAGLEKLAYTLSDADVIDAIEQERRIELFAEWGHRWIDLKRTGKAKEVLSSLAYKQPWVGDFQLLYPIPESEILYNRSLIQNPEYNFYR